jgi:hypothetical protein
MSHREKKIQERKTREAKIEEQIKKGTIIRVTYEEKKKKPALPNRLSPFTTSEEEIQDRQETVEKAVMVYYRMLKDTFFAKPGCLTPKKWKKSPVIRWGACVLLG